MGLRTWLRRLERGARGGLESFVLEDGSLYYYDPTSPKLFLHWYACLTADNPRDWPEPPEVCKKLTEARDPVSAGEQFISSAGNFFPYDPEILITERILEPVSLVAGREVHDQEVEDLSE
jgi:hypothetical protein